MNIRAILVFILYWFIPLSGISQNNLVPNSSFEDYTECPYWPGHIYFAAPWYSAWGSVNYYDSCSVGNYNVPNAQGGGGSK